MIIETVRYMAATLSDGAGGINAKLAAIGLDGSDVRPSNLASIKNEFDDPIAARRQVPSEETTPFAIVFQPREAELQGWVTAEKLDAEDLPVAVVFVQRDADSELANLAGAYYLRCAMQSINGVPNGDASRTRNSVDVLQHRLFLPIVPFMPIGDAVMTRGLLVSWQVRDRDVT